MNVSLRLTGVSISLGDEGWVGVIGSIQWFWLLAFV